MLQLFCGLELVFGLLLQTGRHASLLLRVAPRDTQQPVCALVSVVYMTVCSVLALLAEVLWLIYIWWLQESVHVTVAGSVPSVTLEAFCKQAGEKQGELFYYCHIIDVFCCSTRNSPLNDSSCGPAPCPH